MGKVGRIAVAIVGIGCLMLAMAVGASAARIDRSFGNNGIAEIDPVLSGYSQGFVTAAATGPNGGIYSLTHASNCDPGPGCQVDLYVTRLNRNGASDHGYGSEGRALIAPTGLGSAIAVDSAERQLVATVFPSEMVVTRLQAGGAIDRSFGVDGRAAIPCDCLDMAPYVAVLRGDRVLVLGHRDGLVGEKGIEQIFLGKLASNGEMDRRFGDSGVTKATIHSDFELQTIMTVPGGATILAGTSYSGSIKRPKILASSELFTPDGRLDKQFAINMQRVVEHLSTKGSRPLSHVAAVIPRRHGGLEMIGEVGDGSFALRLHADGGLDRSFGHGGVRYAKGNVYSAASDGAGHVLGVDALPDRELGLAASWLGRGTSFERPPVRIKGMDGLSTQVLMQAGQPLLFLDNLYECLDNCSPHPKFARLLGWGK
jgi:hypothetical protein